jgi:hypothetical protein
LENVFIISNTANSRGGGIYFYLSDPVLINVAITGNDALYCGGGIYCSFANPVIQNVTIADNEYFGIACESSHPVLVNTILWNNHPRQVYFFPSGDPNAISFINSTVMGGPSGIQTSGNGTVYWLGGNVFDDPLFAGTGDDPYSLLPGSPCIDAGKPDTTGLNLPPWDIIGNLRVWDGDGDGTEVIDMGAYEFGSIPVGTDQLNSWTVGQLDMRVYPNPSSGIVYCQFGIVKCQRVIIKIYDLHGREVETVVDEVMKAGEHVVSFDANSLPSGLYVYQKTEDRRQKSEVGKLIKY